MDGKRTLQQIDDEQDEEDFYDELERRSPEEQAADLADYLAEVKAHHEANYFVTERRYVDSYAGVVELFGKHARDCGFVMPAPHGLGKYIEEIFRRACDGQSSSEIAAALGAKTKSVTKFCNRHRIYLQPRITLRDLDYDIRIKAKEGLSWTELAKEFAVSYVAMRKYCVANDIKVRSDRPGFIIQNGYKLVLMPEHPEADSKGYIREHRLVVERSGVKLSKNVVIHHKDGNKLNNDPSNLEVTTDAAHKSHHRKAGHAGRRKGSPFRKKR
jgi:hypothetical protein